MKRLLSLLLVLVLIGSCVPYAMASDVDNRISCGESYESENGTVCVPIRIENNTGFMGFSIKIAYNKNALVPVSVTTGSILACGSLNDSIGTDTPGSVKVVWIHSENVYADGELFVVSFRVLANAEPEENIVISYIQGDTFNEAWQDVVFHCENGCIQTSASSLPTYSNTVLSVASDVMTGEEFDFSVRFENMEEIMGFSIVISYDSAAFLPVSVTCASCFAVGSMNNNIETAAGDLKVVWTGTENVLPDEEAFSVRFVALNTADAGQYTFGISYVQADTFNESWQDVALDCRNAIVTVKNHHDNYIYALEHTANPGEAVSIPVAIKNNEGLMGFSMVISYDKNVFVPVSVSAGEMLSSGVLNDSIGVSPQGSFRVVYTSSGNLSTDGILFTLTFEVNKNAYGSSMIGLSYVPTDTFNEIWDDVALFCEDVAVEIARADIKNTPRFYADRMSIQAGSNIMVPILIENSDNITSFSLTLEYDATLLTPISVAAGEAISGSIVSNLETSQNGLLTVIWSSEAPLLHDGTVVDIVFAAHSFAYAESEILLSCDNIRRADNSAVNAICTPIPIYISDPDDNAPSQLYAESVAAIGGETISIPVCIRNNHGIMGFGITVDYDASVLTPVSVTKGNAIYGGALETSMEVAELGSFKVIWSGNEDMREDGQLFVLQFAVATNPNVDTTTISLEYNAEDTFNEKWQDVTLEIEPLLVPISKLCINAPISDIYAGNSFALLFAYLPESRPLGTITWSSSNPAIASVDQSGNVTAKRRGNVCITATDNYGNIAECYIQVLPTNAQLQIFCEDGFFERKIDWWKKYSSETMKLGFLIYNCDEAVRYVWSTDSWRVDVDQRGNITNSGPFARSAVIKLTAYDAENNVVASSSVTVRFYKFNWQYRRMQSQEVVSDNVLQIHADAQTLTETPYVSTSPFLLLIGYVFDLFGRIVAR